MESIQAPSTSASLGVKRLERRDFSAAEAERIWRVTILLAVLGLRPGPGNRSPRHSRARAPDKQAPYPT